MGEDQDAMRQQQRQWQWDMKKKKYVMRSSTDKGSKGGGKPGAKRIKTGVLARGCRLGLVLVHAGVRVASGLAVRCISARMHTGKLLQPGRRRWRWWVGGGSPGGGVWMCALLSLPFPPPSPPPPHTCV